MAIQVRKDFGTVDKRAIAAETFWLANKPIFSSPVSKNGEVYAPETSFMKETCVHIKNMSIKQFCNRKVPDFAILRARKVFQGFRETGPRTDRNRGTMLLRLLKV